MMDDDKTCPATLGGPGECTCRKRSTRFVPLGDRILVHVLAQEKMLEGVLLPDSSKDDMQVGVVVAVGETIPDEFIGAHLMFGPWAGKDIQIEGVPFRVLRFEEIDGKVISIDEGTSRDIPQTERPVRLSGN